MPAPPQRTDHVRARRRARSLAALVAAAGLALVAACSSGGDREAADVTLPKLATTTTTTAPPGSGLAPEGEEAPPPEWTVQVGGAGDDRLTSPAGHDDTVVAVGTTTGSVELPGDDAPTPGGPETTTPDTTPPGGAGSGAGGTDVLVAVVDTDGTPRSVRTTGTDGEDVANGVTVHGTEPLACGSTTGQLGAFLGGSSDLWCALVADDEEVLGSVAQFGGTDGEELTGVSGSVEGEHAYGSGRAAGLLPGAQDPTGRGLGGGDAIALQLAPGASPVWARQFGTPFDDGALGVAVSPDGDGILVGYTDGDLGRESAGGRDAWITRFDPQGRQRWITQFGSAGSDVATAVAVAGEARRGTEQFIAVGTTDGDLGETALAGMSDAFVAAVGPDGTLAWTTTLGSDAEDRAAGVVADGALLYVAGTTRGELGDLQPDTGPGGGADGFLAAMDAATGQVVWTARFGSAGDEEITGITTTEDGLVVLSGTTTGQMSDTAPGGGLDGFLIAFPLNSAGGGAASTV